MKSKRPIGDCRCFPCSAHGSNFWWAVEQDLGTVAFIRRLGADRFFLYQKKPFGLCRLEKRPLARGIRRGNGALYNLLPEKLPAVNPPASFAVHSRFASGTRIVVEGGSVRQISRFRKDKIFSVHDIAGFPYFREWRRVCLSDRGTEDEELSGTFWRFHSLQADGIMVISRIPGNASLPGETGDILRVSAEEEEWSIDRGNSDVRTYRLVSDVYEVTEKSPDSNYAAAMHVSADFISQYEGSLYILCRNKETGRWRS